jgi:hypothetical protein
MSTCPQCDQPGIFGYRDKNTGEMTWYCTTHRLGQYWGDARRDQSTSPPPDHPSSASPICNLHAVNEPMTDPHLVTLNPEQRPGNLIQGLKFQLAQSLFGSTIIRACRWCGGLFEAGAGAKVKVRKDSTFCCREHSVLYHSHKRSKGDR